MTNLTSQPTGHHVDHARDLEPASRHLELAGDPAEASYAPSGGVLGVTGGSSQGKWIQSLVVVQE
jgi:hypothetical protein